MYPEGSHPTDTDQMMAALLGSEDENPNAAPRAGPVSRESARPMTNRSAVDREAPENMPAFTHSAGRFNRPTSRASFPTGPSVSIHNTPLERVVPTRYVPSVGPIAPQLPPNPNLPTRKYAFEYRGIQSRNSGPIATHADARADQSHSPGRPLDLMETQPKMPAHFPAVTKSAPPLAGKPTEHNLDLRSAGNPGLFSRLSRFGKK